MKKLLSNVVMSVIVSTSSASVFADELSTSTMNYQPVMREQITAMAINTCQQTAVKRYGDASIQRISDKAKWSNSLRGATVDLVVSPTNRTYRKPYTVKCLVDTTQHITWFRL